MPHAPLAGIVNEPLHIERQCSTSYISYVVSENSSTCQARETSAEKATLSKVMDDLLDRMAAGVVARPSKLCVMTEFQQSLKPVEPEDTEAREHFGTALETIMDILNIESSDGLLAAYLGGI